MALLFLGFCAFSVPERRLHAARRQMVLVTGASGRVGSQVVRALRGMGHPVRAMVRPGGSYFWLNDTGCDYFFADLRDPKALRRACRGASHLVACSGVARERRGDDHATTTAQGHRQLWQAALGAEIAHVVFVSALGVGRGYAVPWFDARRQAEDALADSGLPWSVLRAAPTSRHYADRAHAAAKRGWAPMVGGGRNLVAPISPRDLASLAISALDHPAFYQRAVAVAGPEALSAEDALRRALLFGGAGAPPRRLPAVGALLPKRYRHQIAHWRRWESDDFVAPMGAICQATGLSLTPLDQALRADIAEARRWSDPEARRQVPQRRIPHVDTGPAVMPIAKLPRGPRCYP